MSRPLKYLEGDPITTIAEFAAVMEARQYIIHRHTKQRINPGWAGSWQFRVVMDGVRKQIFAHALRNPEHPDFQEEKP